MIEQKLREILAPILEEVYAKGFKDGARNTIDMYRFGWQNGHSETMAALGEIDIEELTEEEYKEIINA